MFLAIGLCVKAGGFSFEHGIPMDVLLEKTKDAGVNGQPGSFCDFSRYAKNRDAVKNGNLWGLPVNLIAFSLVAGITTLAAFKVYGEVLLHPEQISAKFDSRVLALVAALTFAVATLGTNVVANFASAAFDISNVFPKRIDFKKGGYIAAAIALVLYPFAPWEGGAAHFVNAIGATMGTLLGIILVATGVGAVFSTVLPNFTRLLPSWWGTYGWFFGVLIGGGVYWLMATLRPRQRAALTARAP